MFVAPYYFKTATVTQMLIYSIKQGAFPQGCSGRLLSFQNPVATSQFYYLSNIGKNYMLLLFPTAGKFHKQYIFSMYTIP